MADGGGIEPPHPCGLGALATRCLTSRPTVRGWRKRQESNLQGLAARTVFGTGPLANGVCASICELRSLVPLAGFEPATSAFVVPEARFQRDARHLYRLGYRGSSGIGMDGRAISAQQGDRSA